MKPEDFKKEAEALIEHFSGYVPQTREWKKECEEFFVETTIEKRYWDTVYYEALLLQNKTN